MECTIDFAHRLHVWTCDRIVGINLKMQKLIFQGHTFGLLLAGAELVCFL